MLVRDAKARQLRLELLGAHGLQSCRQSGRGRRYHRDIAAAARLWRRRVELLPQINSLRHAARRLSFCGARVGRSWRLRRKPTGTRARLRSVRGGRRRLLRPVRVAAAATTTTSTASSCLLVFPHLRVGRVTWTRELRSRRRACDTRDAAAAARDQREAPKQRRGNVRRGVMRLAAQTQ